MSWTENELRLVDATDEVEIASTRPDGTLRPFVTIWFVRVGEDVYVRSAYGPDNGWFRRASASGRGRVRFAGVTKDVTFTAADGVADVVDDAYRTAYAGRYSPSIVGTVLGEPAASATLRVTPT